MMLLTSASARFVAREISFADFRKECPAFVAGVEQVSQSSSLPFQSPGLQGGEFLLRHVAGLVRWAVGASKKAPEAFEGLDEGQVGQALAAAITAQHRAVFGPARPEADPVGTSYLGGELSGLQQVLAPVLERRLHDLRVLAHFEGEERQRFMAAAVSKFGADSYSAVEEWLMKLLEAVLEGRRVLSSGLWTYLNACRGDIFSEVERGHNRISLDDDGDAEEDQLSEGERLLGRVSLEAWQQETGGSRPDLETWLDSLEWKAEADLAEYFARYRHTSSANKRRSYWRRAVFLWAICEGFKEPGGGEAFEEVLARFQAETGYTDKLSSKYRSFVATVREEVPELVETLEKITRLREYLGLAKYDLLGEIEKIGVAR